MIKESALSSVVENWDRGSGPSCSRWEKHATAKSSVATQSVTERDGAPESFFPTEKSTHSCQFYLKARRPFLPCRHGRYLL